MIVYYKLANVLKERKEIRIFSTEKTGAIQIQHGTYQDR